MNEKNEEDKNKSAKKLPETPPEDKGHFTPYGKDDGSVGWAEVLTPDEAAKARAKESKSPLNMPGDANIPDSSGRKN